jgi:hypothetical protein
MTRAAGQPANGPACCMPARLSARIGRAGACSAPDAALMPVLPRAESGIAVANGRLPPAEARVQP